MTSFMRLFDLTVKTLHLRGCQRSRSHLRGAASRMAQAQSLTQIALSPQERLDAVTMGMRLDWATCTQLVEGHRGDECVASLSIRNQMQVFKLAFSLINGVGELSKAVSVMKDHCSTLDASWTEENAVVRACNNSLILYCLCSLSGRLVYGKDLLEQFDSPSLRMGNDLLLLLRGATDENSTLVSSCLHGLLDVVIEATSTITADFPCSTLGWMTGFVLPEAVLLAFRYDRLPVTSKFLKAAYALESAVALRCYNKRTTATADLIRCYVLINDTYALEFRNPMPTMEEAMAISLEREQWVADAGGSASPLGMGLGSPLVYMENGIWQIFVSGQVDEIRQSLVGSYRYYAIRWCLARCMTFWPPCLERAAGFAEVPEFMPRIFFLETKLMKVMYNVNTVYNDSARLLKEVNAVFDDFLATREIRRVLLIEVGLCYCSVYDRPSELPLWILCMTSRCIEGLIAYPDVSTTAMMVPPKVFRRLLEEKLMSLGVAKSYYYYLLSRGRLMATEAMEILQVMRSHFGASTCPVAMAKRALELQFVVPDMFGDTANIKETRCKVLPDYGPMIDTLWAYVLADHSYSACLAVSRACLNLHEKLGRIEKRPDHYRALASLMAYAAWHSSVSRDAEDPFAITEAMLEMIRGMGDDAAFPYYLGKVILHEQACQQNTASYEAMMDRAARRIRNSLSGRSSFFSLMKQAWDLPWSLVLFRLLRRAGKPVTADQQRTLCAMKLYCIEFLLRRWTELHEKEVEATKNLYTSVATYYSRELPFTTESLPHLVNVRKLFNCPSENRFDLDYGPVSTDTL